MLTLYSYQDSGNSYKPRLLLAHLGLPFGLVDTSSRDGTTRTAEFLARSPIGKVPLLELDDGRYLAESNAILLHLAEGTRFLPGDAYDRAKVYEWLFFEQYSHEPYIAVRRAMITYPERASQATPERMAATLEGGIKALAVMEARLAGHDWLAGDGFSVADISLYGYTHDCHVGGFDLEQFPGVKAWIDRVAGEPGHVDLAWRPEA
jgi:glutathione S-transferase